MAAPTTGRVSVICAPPNGRNPGMTSVDLAFETVAAQAGLADVTYWRLWDVSEWAAVRGPGELVSADGHRDADTGVTYRLLRGRVEEALDADRVVYWGDFMHMAVYQRQMSDVLSRRIGLYPVEEADAVVAESQLLRGVPDAALGKVVSYGSTLSLNTWHDYASPYGADLERFVGGAEAVWFRDPYSSQVARLIRDPEGGSTQALDAAFLLHDGVQRGGRGLGVFIGRSEVRPEVVAALGRRLATRLGMPAQWIPWGVEPAFWPVDGRRRFRAAWPALEHGAGDPGLSDLMRTRLAALRGVPKEDRGSVDIRDLIFGLGDFDVVLTDTYHLAINAWAQGVPAICLIDRGGNEWSVNSGEPNMRRDKRVDLYSQLDALGLIVDLSGLGHRVSREVDRVVELLDTLELLAVVKDRIARQRRQSMDAIVRQLSGIRPSGNEQRPAPAPA